jgi:hypothetical protein
MPFGRPVVGWLVAAGVCAATTVGLNWKTVRDPDRARTAPASSYEREPLLLSFNDTEPFLRHLDAAAAAIGHGRLVFPVSDYDCPVSFLALGGAVRAATDWPGRRVLNLFALVALFLTGLSAYGLFRELDADPALALVAAVGFQTANVAFYYPYMGHLHCAQLQWVPASVWALAAVLRTGRWSAAVALGLVMGFQVLSSPYYTLYLGYFALPAFAAGYWFAARRAGPAPSVPGLVARGGLAVAIALAVAAVYLAPRLGSMPVVHPLDPENGYHVNSVRGFFDPRHPILYLGWGVIGLGVVGLILSRTDPSPAAAGTVAGLYAVCLMILPGVVGSPYWLAYHTLPLLDRTRAPIRLAPFVLLFLLGATALALTRLTAGRPWWVRVAGVGTLVTAVAANWFTSPWVLGPTE